MWGATYGMQAKKAIPECVLSMIYESHFPTVTEGELTDDHVQGTDGGIHLLVLGRFGRLLHSGDPRDQ